MRYLMLTIIAVTAAGCAAQTPTHQTAAARHAANVAAAEDAGYQVINNKDQMLFCPTRAPIGSHIVRACLTETQWERHQLWVSAGTGSSGQGESGRSPMSGFSSYGR